MPQRLADLFATAAFFLMRRDNIVIGLCAFCGALGLRDFLLRTTQNWPSIETLSLGV